MVVCYTEVNRVVHPRLIVDHSPNPKYHIAAPNVAANAHVLGLAR